MKDLAEVCPLSREILGSKVPSLSFLLRGGFRFFRFPVPAVPLAHLTTTYRRSEDIGLTVFRRDTQVG
jgi:hypothetical protein